MRSYTVPAYQLPSIRERFAAAARGGCGPTLTVLRTRTIVSEDGVSAQEVVVVQVDDGEPLPGGWHVVGEVAHGVDEATRKPANVVLAFDGLSVPSEYRTSAPTCDFCEAERNRRTTVLLTNADRSEWRQVGTTCAYRVFGIKAADLLGLAALPAGLSAAADGVGYRREGFALLPFLCLTATHTYVSKRAVQPGRQTTAQIVWRELEALSLRHDTSPLERAAVAHGAFVEAAMAWAASVDAGDNDYMANLQAVVAQGMVTERTSGYAASLLEAYRRRLADAARLERPSEYLGTVGLRFGSGKGKKAVPALALTVLRAHTFFGAFGQTTIVSMQDADGNDVITFSTGDVTHATVGASVLVTGTVKAHEVDVRTSRKQTILSRVSFAKA